MDPTTLLFHLIDHQLKEESLQLSREQLAISKQQLTLAYQRMGMDAEKLRLYQERNAMEWERFEQQQSSYVYDLFKVYDDEKRAFTLRYFTEEKAFTYLMVWLVTSRTLPCSVEQVPLLMLLPAAQKRALVEAYLDNSLHQAIPHAVQLALEGEAKRKEQALPVENKANDDWERHVKKFTRQHRFAARYQGTQRTLWGGIRQVMLIYFIPASANVVPPEDCWYQYESEFGYGWHRRIDASDRTKYVLAYPPKNQNPKGGRAWFDFDELIITN
ncbi:MAG: hypothetical protein EAY65_02355 [Alphaproteobacteria bacterium]|nr:MAG: hypothetical protein EAY65_02355 [Alphaproteobacteria bacterium]